MMNNIERKSELFILSEDDSKYVKDVLKEVDREEAIRKIKIWITESNDFQAPTDDFFILRFLRGCKYDIEKTQKKLKNYFSERNLAPQWFGDRNPLLPEIQELLKLGVMLPLRKVDDQGRMVVIIRTCVHNPNKHKQNDVFKTDLMVLDLAIHDNVPVSVKGVVAIFDMTGVSLAHATHLTPSMIKRLVHLWQSCYPLRIQAIEFVNAPFHVNVVLNIFKQFMSQKLQERMHVHRGSYLPIHQIVPVTILPAELGGLDENYEALTNYWKIQCENNADWFKEDEKFKTSKNS